jgi:DNA-binding SARP family transcriptional activator
VAVGGSLKGCWHNLAASALCLTCKMWPRGSRRRTADSCDAGPIVRYGDVEPFPQFGALVREYRRQAGLTQQELAAKTGLSVAALRDFEQCRRHHPRPSSLTALAEAFGLSPDQSADLARAAALAGRPVSQGLWLSVLGPLEAWRDGMPLSLGTEARRAVLGLLVMDPGVPVRREAIIDALWGDAPPPTAVGLVQAHVSRLRRVMEPQSRPPGGHGGIESARGAYRLLLSSQELDLLAFRELAARAARARAEGDDAAACELYERAICLWRGDPLADVDLLSGHPGAALLRQQLGSALLRYAEVACAVGQHQKVLPRLQALAAAEPLNEPAHARLMIALTGSGQRTAALSVYEDLRLLLDRELGLRLGEELAEAHLRVLRQDIPTGRRGQARAQRPVPAVAAPAVPRQLPSALRPFTGRASEFDALSGLLKRDSGQASGVVVVALTGPAGTGKTALAVHWARQAADRFPDGQLFTYLCGSATSGGPITPSVAACCFLTALGVPAERIPADIDGQAGLYRSMLADRRMIIVLDNARDAEQVRPLLPGSPGCLVLVTSRNRLTGLAAAEGAHLLTLDVMPGGGSCDLPAVHPGAGRAKADPSGAANDRLVRRPGGRQTPTQCLDRRSVSRR